MLHGFRVALKEVLFQIRMVECKPRCIPLTATVFSLQQIAE